jgi:hypothetical protein
VCNRIGGHNYINKILVLTGRGFIQHSRDTCLSRCPAQQLAAVSVSCGSGVPAKVRSVLSKMAFAASLVWTTE